MNCKDRFDQEQNNEDKKSFIPVNSPAKYSKQILYFVLLRVRSTSYVPCQQGLLRDVDEKRGRQRESLLVFHFAEFGFLAHTNYCVYVEKLSARSGIFFHVRTNVYDTKMTSSCSFIQKLTSGYVPYQLTNFLKGIGVTVLVVLLQC